MGVFIVRHCLLKAMPSRYGSRRVVAASSDWCGLVVVVMCPGICGYGRGKASVRSLVEPRALLRER